MKKSCFIIVICFSLFNTAFTQGLPEPDLHSSSSSDLLHLIGEEKRKALKKLPYRNSEINKDYNRLAQSVKYMVRNEYFVQDDSVENYLLHLVDNLSDKNMLEQKIVRVLILDSEERNAFSLGIGIIGVTVGLLAQVESEDQLCSVLAHEMAHIYNGHQFISVTNKSAIEDRKEIMHQAILIRDHRITPEDIKSFQAQAYKSFREKQVREIQADSLGLNYLIKAGYSPQAMINFWNYSGDIAYPDFNLDEKLFLPFYFEGYPIRMEWFQKPSSKSISLNHFFIMI